MRLLTLLFIVACAPEFQLLAQDTTVTEKNYLMEEVIVTASRTGIGSLDSPVSTEVIHREQIENSGINRLSDLLTTKAGMEIKDYGGTNGAKLLSFRGSTSEQVLVLVNGVRVNSSASGLTDLSLYGLDNVERVEIYRGGASGLYGSDAVGGVVNIITTKSIPLKKISAGTEFKTSSFDHRQAQFFIQLPVAGWGASAVYAKEFQPDSSYKVNDPVSGKKLTRVNSSTGSDALSVNLDRIFNKLDVHGTTRLFSRRAELPNTIENNSSYLAQAKQNDQLVFIEPQLTYRYSEKLTLKGYAAYTYSKIEYSDDRNGTNDFTKTRTFFSEGFLQSQITSNQELIAGYTFTRFAANGSNIASTVNNLNGIFSEDRIKFTLSKRFFFDRMLVYPSIRWDHYSVYDGSFSPKLGFSLSARRERAYYALRASIGRNFRAPTFNERFWAGDGAVGNSAIKPERSLSMDAGATVGISASESYTVEVNVNVYRIRTEDQIVWQQGAITPSLWSPVNVATALTKGAEVIINHRYRKVFSSELNYTYNRAMDISDGSPHYRLRYSPLHSLKVTNEISYRRLSVSQTTRYVSQRFVSLDNSTYLKPYWITDAFMNYRIKWSPVLLKVGMGVNNLFDASYETIALYPGTAREWVVLFGITY